ncbi:MAG: outer membrane protein transport protein [Desulfobulbus sp.]|nr:outer membrane protein transport protein [Desulfobulbus sp.]
MAKTWGMAGLILLTATGSALAAGYSIPEQSVNSVALAGGYVANTPGADATYYNPANMSWLENRTYLEANGTWIHLTSVKYRDDRTPAWNGKAEAENFFMPTLFAVSPDFNNFRFGFSITAPAGLAKEWRDPYPATYAEKFAVKVFEFNPTVSYRVNDRFSLAAGIRGVYVDGQIMSHGTVPVNDIPTPYGPMDSSSRIGRYMDGDAWEAGYNLALSIRPMDKMNIGITYRSKIDLSVKGHANMSTSDVALPALGGIVAIPGSTYNGDAGVEIPLPAVLAVAASYTFFDQLTVELGYNRTYWSSYDTLAFTYPSPLGNPVMQGAFGDPRAKSWSDTDTWRLSVAYDFKNNWILMAGFAIDENPAPDNTLGFELPDADARLYSIGVRYIINDSMEIGAAYLYDDKESRHVNNQYAVGEFTNEAAHLVTIGFSYKF